MVPCKAKVVAASVLVSLAQWTLSGCAWEGDSGGGGGVVVTSTRGGANDFPFPGGIGVSSDLGATEGVATDPDDNVYVSSQEVLTAYNKKWQVLWSNTNPLAGMPSAVDHLGDIEYGNGYIYAPAEAWSSCSSFTPVLLAVYDARTGQQVTWSNITADGHEASAVAVVPGSNQLVVTSFCPNQNGDTTLWNYDLNALTTNPSGSTMTYSSTTTLSSAISEIQGISWNAAANQFAVSTDMDGTAGSLWLVTPAGTVSGPIYIVPASVGTELEGVDYISGDLYFLESGYVYGVGAVPATPVINLASGTYCAAQAVTITDATTDAIVYYTTDGTMPTTSSTVYAGAITVSASETIRAIAMAGGLATSAQSTATYTIDTSGCPAVVKGH